jgi:Cell Wall Hydrolase
MPIQWSGTITSPQQLAGVIQGESSSAAGQFAVASVMYNRVQNGSFGSGITGVVTPTQFNGYQTPGANATALANDLWAGNAPSGGSTGNALYFANPNGSTASWPSTLPGSGAVNIGGNWFTDRLGPPSANFQAPQYGGAGSTIAEGPPDNASGSTPASGSTDPLTGWSVTANPSGTSSTSASGTAQGTPIQTALQPEEVSQIGSWISGIESAFGGGVKGVVTAAENAIGTYFGSLQNWFTRAALILLGIVILAIALIALMWDHGGKQVAGNIQMAAAA